MNAAPALRAEASTRRLSEVARHVVYGDGLDDTGWWQVEARCSEFGDTFDEWQRGAGQIMLGLRAGEYAATVGGITLSIPRQVAKTFLISRIVFALCSLYPNMTVLWSAHRTRTASKTYSSLKSFAGRKSVAKYLAPDRSNGLRNVNGEQEIRFSNGSIIMFGAREQGFGRGFDEVDIEVFDEAQILTEKALEDMVAATNQSRFPAGALLFFMGTPPRPVDPGEAFTLRREAALEVAAARSAGQEAEVDFVYIECSADQDADPEDRAQWAKANPSFPHRTPLRSMLRLRKNLPSDESWRREALGIWNEFKHEKPEISASLWGSLRTDSPPTEGDVTYGIRFSVDGSTVAVAAALRSADGDVHAELIDTAPMSVGTASLAKWVLERKDHRFVIDGKSGRDALVNTLISKGFKPKNLLLPNTDQVIAAHSMMLEAIKSASVSHFDDETLNDSVAHAGKRSIGTAGGWGWRPLGEGDVTPFEAVTLAHFGAVESKTRRQRSGRSVFR